MGLQRGGGGINGNILDEEALGLGHGTHTAGIICSAWDGHGLSGVASNAKIVSIQLPNASGVESMADVLNAYDFINRFNEQAPEAERTKVANNSWSQYLTTRALDAAVRDVGDRWGIVSVFSVGNDGKNNDYYEKTRSLMVDNPYAIVVASSTATEKLDESSEYGKATVDLAAPGSVILSTLPLSRSRYYADASMTTNLAYAGFDSDAEVPVTVTQLDATSIDGRDHLPIGEPAKVSEVGMVVSNVHFYGERSLKVELDPTYSSTVQVFDSTSDYYLVSLTLDVPRDDMASHSEKR